MLAGCGRLSLRALEEPFNPCAATLSVSQWHESDAEYRSTREATDRDALAGAGPGTAHLNQPRRLFAIGAPAVLEQGIVQLAFLAFFAIVARYGTSAFAAYGIGASLVAFPLIGMLTVPFLVPAADA